MSEDNKFFLKSSSADFTLRQKSIFDQLILVEKERNRLKPQHEIHNMDVDLNPDHVEDNVNSAASRGQRAITKKLRGKESIFKKPQNPVPKNYINKIPDFKKNPHKWTRYTLDDVKDEDMSDRSNTKAALSFLEELRERKAPDPNNLKVESPQKVIFEKQRKPEINSKVDPNSEELKPTFQSSKRVMPEYVVGQNLKKDKKKKEVTKGRELKLDHLYQDE